MTLFYDDELADARSRAEIVDLFAGPGGWSEAIAALGRRDIGIELDRWACATRRAAGHPTIEASVSDVDPTDYSGATGLIASPPCQAFSASGTKTGRAHIDALLAAIDTGNWACRPARDPNIWLVLEVGRWVEALWPEWIVLEQVPAVLPLWERYADRFAAAGYSTWAGILNAADYGVPQIRKRAVLIASRARTVNPPHHSHGTPPRRPWVTMGEALGWDNDTTLGLPRIDDKGTSPTGYRERDLRSADQPSFTVTEKARSWIVSTGRRWNKEAGTSQTFDAATSPALTLTTKSGTQWQLPGSRREATSNLHPGRSEHTVLLTAAQALVLQSFPATYPVKGTRSRQFEQIGNAVPPRLAEAVLRCVIATTSLA